MLHQIRRSKERNRGESIMTSDVTKIIGDYGELFTSYHFIKKGYSVFENKSSNNIDLIVIKDKIEDHTKRYYTKNPLMSMKEYRKSCKSTFIKIKKDETILRLQVKTGTAYKDKKGEQRFFFTIRRKKANGKLKDYKGIDRFVFIGVDKSLRYITGWCVPASIIRKLNSRSINISKNTKKYKKYELTGYNED